MKDDIFDKITIAILGIVTILAILITIRMMAVPSKQYYTVKKENNIITVEEK